MPGGYTICTAGVGTISTWHILKYIIMGKGLGDLTEDLIKAVAPRLAEAKKDCIPCKRKKEWLNNIGAIFG